MSAFENYLKNMFPAQQPAVRPFTTAIDSLLQPRQDEMRTPENFVRGGLLEDGSVGKQLSLLGLGFAPGAGFSDYAGTYPSAQGGTEPSFQQNISQGNYITAGLQGLGAMGDAATATGAALGPLGLAAGMGVGSIAKAPRAIQRGVEGLIDVARPKIDEMGFFSQVEKSIMDNPQAKGTGQQFLAQLQKTPGVKPEELQYTGLDTFLANKPTVTKTEIQDFLDTSKVQLQEVTLGSKQSIANRDEAIASRYGYEAIVDDNGVAFFNSNLNDFVEFRDLPAAMRTQLSNPQTEFGGFAKFGEKTLPGGENYREVLLRMPSKQKSNKFTLRNNESGGSVGSFDTMEEAEEFLQTTPRQDIRSGNFSIQETASGTEEVYRSSHFDQPNILAHMRLNDRVVDGKPTLFVEEIQSDWHQAGRKKGYDTPEARAAEQQKLDTIVANRQSLLDEKTRLEQLAEPYTSQGKDAPSEIVGRWSAISNQLNDLQRQSDRLGSNFGDFVPDAPFKTTWDELTLKRAIKMASDEGYEQIAFTTGKTQADRYDLSKQIDSIAVSTIEGDTRIVKIIPKDKSPNFNLQVNTKDGTVVATMSLSSRQFRGKKLDEVVGKDIASKLLGATEPQTLSGVDLSIGGEGMKGFYDKILPKKIEKMGKKYGVKPVLTEMDTPDGKVQVWKFPIPKEMSKTVQEQGQPLFQIGAGAAGLGTAGLLATEEDQF